MIALGLIIAPAKSPRAGNRTYPILSMTMHGGLVDQADKFKKRVASEDTSAYKIVYRDQLVVGFPIDEGVLSFQKLYDEAIVSPAYAVWDISRESVDINYLEKFLRSPRALQFYSGKLRSTTARRRSIPQDTFLELPVPLPPLNEQRRIAEILDKADRLRQKRRNAIALLDGLTHSIYREMFGDPVSNPKGWPATKIGDLDVAMTYGPRFHHERYVDHGTRIVRITDLASTGELDYLAMPRLLISDTELAEHRSRPGDILFARTGATVGKTALIRENDPVSIPGAYFIRMRFPSTVLPEFAWATIRYPSIQKIIFEGSRQSAQQNFSGPGLRRLPFIMPPIDEQHRFAEATLRAQRFGSLPKAGGDKLHTLFSSLQHRAFSGQL